MVHLTVHITDTTRGQQTGQDDFAEPGRLAVAPAVCQVHVKEAENRNSDIPACNWDDRAHDKGPIQLHLGQRERERTVPTAAQCPCRHPTNTLPIVSAASCSRLCKHPPPRRSVEAIFRPRAGSDFMGNVRLSLPLSGGWTFPAASLDQRRALDDRRRAGPGKAETAKHIVSPIYCLHFQSFCSRCTPMQKLFVPA